MLKRIGLSVVFVAIVGCVVASLGVGLLPSAYGDAYDGKLFKEVDDYAFMDEGGYVCICWETEKNCTPCFIIEQR
jgi:hypothetical protein